MILYVSSRVPKCSYRHVVLSKLIALNWTLVKITNIINLKVGNSNLKQSPRLKILTQILFNQTCWKLYTLFFLYGYSKFDKTDHFACKMQ